MATFLHGIFKDINEDVILVEIHSSLGSGDITIGEDNQSGEIYFSDDPVEINTECDDLDVHIIKKTCTISLVTTIYLGNVLFAANEKSVEVEIFKNTNCIFSGYLEPYTYSQPWAYALEEITLNCIDKLCCLQYEYFLDDKTWADKKDQNNVLSFHDYLSMILPTSTYWDQSKVVNGISIFDAAGVSMNVFLGKSEKDVWNNEKILEEILRFCNLHIIQEGRRMFIFDWNSIGATASWDNLYDASTVMTDASTIAIDKDTISSDDTNLSMSDVYNQIVLKCELEEKEDVLASPLESDDIEAYTDVKQLFYSEYIGESGSSRAFKDVIYQGYNHPESIVNDNPDWYRQDWYFKWMNNPSWNIYYHGKPISDWLERDGNGKYINMHRILRAMRENPFMPALLWVGKNENKINRQRSSRLNGEGKPTGTINGKTYLAISVNGDYDNSERRLGTYDDQIYYATHSATGEHVGLLTFSGESGIFSPADDDTTNYIIFNGSMVLNPPRIEIGTVQTTPPAPYKTFETVYNELMGSVDMIIPWLGEFEDIIDQSGNMHYLAQQFWTCQNPTDLEQANNRLLMIYPYSDTPKVKTMEYNYSDYGDSTDKIDKLSILECELRIGDKYLVEVETGDRKKPSYQWLTTEQCPTIDGVVKKTFSLGIDPLIDEPIIGKEYELANTVNGRYSNEKGTAIPITKEDALSGDVEFKILGIYNSQWNYITRRHPTMLRHTKYYDNWKNLLSYVSSIWIKDFNIKIISDNEGYDVSSKSKDLVYISDEAEGYIKKKDDITFKINTMPTTDELLAIGISTNVSNTNVVNMQTNQPLEEISDVANNETDRAERLYVNEYYNFYCTPKVIVNTSLRYNSSGYPFKLYTLSGFGTLMPLKADYKLKTAEVNLTCRQK